MQQLTIPDRAGDGMTLTAEVSPFNPNMLRIVATNPEHEGDQEVHIDVFPRDLLAAAIVQHLPEPDTSDPIPPSLRDTILDLVRTS